MGEIDASEDNMEEEEVIVENFFYENTMKEELSVETGVLVEEVVPIGKETLAEIEIQVETGI